MSVEFGETVRYEKHDSEMMKASFEFVLRDCEIGGFKDNKFGEGKQLSVNLNTKNGHMEILEDMVRQCEKRIGRTGGNVQRPWNENKMIWAKLESDMIIRIKKGNERIDSRVEDHKEPFKADILFEMSGVFIGNNSKAYIQMKIAEVLVHPKEPRTAKL